MIQETIYTKHGFTLAEVLITLGIIGVVAAITLPVLINKIHDKEYDRAKEKALMSIGEAGRILAVNGEINSASNAEDFVKNYLSKQLKIVKYCNSNNLTDCGLSEKITTLDSTTIIDMPKNISELGLKSLGNSPKTYNVKDNPSYGFVTNNGFSVNLFYNPGCINKKVGSSIWDAPDYVCFSAVYDMNGLRNPNQVGKDIGFVTILYPDLTNVAIAPNIAPKLINKSTYAEARAQCTNIGKEYNIPNVEELLSIAYNGNLLGNIKKGDYYWTSVRSKELSYAIYIINFEDGRQSHNAAAGHHYGICTKR